MKTRGAEPLPGDLDAEGDLAAVFAAAGADALINVASLGFGHAPRMVAAAEKAGLKRSVFVSTTAIFTSLPAPTKAVRQAAEQTVEASALAWTIVRPTMIYGAPGDRNIERLLRVLRWAPVVPLPGGGQGLVQPVHVADLAWFLVRILEPDGAARAFNVAGPEPVSLREVVIQAAAAMGRRAVPLPVPLAPVRAAVRAYERVARRPRIKEEQILRLEEDKAFDIADAVALGYQPRSLAQGLQEEVMALAAAQQPRS